MPLRRSSPVENINSHQPPRNNRESLPSSPPTSTIHQSSPRACLRRSRKIPAITPRAKQYFDSYKSRVQDNHFPSNGDQIAVRWILDNKFIWWPARVVSINSASSSAFFRSGIVHYNAHRQYSTEEMEVLFYWNEESQDRFVSRAPKVTPTSFPKDTHDLCSWMPLSDVEDMGEITVERRTNNTLANSSSASSDVPFDIAYKGRPRNVNRKQTSQSRRASLPLSSTPKPRGITKTNTHSTTKTGNSVADDMESNQGTTSNRKHRSSDKSHTCERSSPPTNNLDNAAPLVGHDNDANSEHLNAFGDPSHTVQPETQSSSYNNAAFQVRLELLERKMQEVHHSSASTMSSTAHSVITILKWSFLRQLEKPLKDLKLPELSTIGIASYYYEVSAQCDYSTFRELASSLAQTHNCLNLNECSGRVAFSPSFHIIQSGSVASDNLTIIFSLLSDLTNFLQIRDELDFEKMLSKELVTEERSFLRLLGTFIIDNGIDNRNINSGSAYQTEPTDSHSISIDSSKHMAIVAQSTKMLKIFVASAPFPTNNQTSSPTKHLHTTNINRSPTTVIEQECAYFDSTRGAYQTEWKSTQCSSGFKVNCTFDLDGIARPSELGNYFTLSWSKFQAPSVKKWTRDVHSISNNSPGLLTLRVPSVFVSARQNVIALSSILDNNIECYMGCRSLVQNKS